MGGFIPLIFLLELIIKSMDNLFDICVELLKWLGGVVNLSYKEINIWVFVIIEPIIFILMLIWILRLKSKNFPSDYLHSSWRDYLYWDSILERD